MVDLSPAAKDSMDLLYAMSFSLEQAILDDFLLFDVGPYLVNALAMTAQAGIQVGPDYMRAAMEPWTTMAGEMGEGMRGLGALTTVIGRG